MQCLVSFFVSPLRWSGHPVEGDQFRISLTDRLQLPRIRHVNSIKSCIGTHGVLSSAGTAISRSAGATRTSRSVWWPSAGPARHLRSAAAVRSTASRHGASWGSFPRAAFWRPANKSRPPRIWTRCTHTAGSSRWYRACQSVPCAPWGAPAAGGTVQADWWVRRKCYHWLPA